MTREQAVALAGTEWWVGREPLDIAMFQLFEDKLCCPFPVFHEAVEKAMGRPVFTHEFAASNRDVLRKELLGDKAGPTMEEIIGLIPAEKRIVVGL